MDNLNLDNRTIGRFPARSSQKTIAPGQLGYRILYTRGDELLPPDTYRSSFDNAVSRSLGGTSTISDDMAARAFGVSSTAFACEEYRATTAASIPLHVTNPAGELLTGTFLDYTLTVAPNLIANIVRSCLLWGRTYVRKHRNAQGWPTKLEWLNPLDVEEQAAADGTVIRYDVLQANGFTREPVAPVDMIYFQLFDPQPGGRGLSRFEVAWRHLNVEQGIVTYSAAFFLNGAAPDGVVSFDNPILASDFERAKAEWQRVFRGATKQHKTAVMPTGMKYTPIQSVPKDLAMVDLKDSEREDICAIFETDPVLVGLKGIADALSANSTYSIAEVAHIRRVTLPFLKMIVLPALNKQWAHRDFDKPNYYTLAIDENAIPQLAENNLQKSTTVISLSDSALVDYNEARKVIGYPEREGYLTRDPASALLMWDAGTITLKQFSQLTGAPIVPGVEDYIKFDGIPIPLQELPNLWRYKLLVAPSVYNSQLITGAPLPEPAAPTTVIPTTDGGNHIAAPQDVETVDNPPPALPATVKSSRSDMPLTLAVSFAGNQFIRYAKRALSEALTGQGISAEWVDESAWRYVLAQVDEWTPTAVSSMLRTVDYGSTTKADVQTDDFMCYGNDIYLNLTADSIDPLMKAIRLDLDGAGLTLSNRNLLYEGVKICTINSEADLSALPPQPYTLVANNVTLYMGNEPYHCWNLRGVSNALLSELKQWRHKAERKGAGVAFNPDALDGSPVVSYITKALRAGMAVKAVFDAAEQNLRDGLAFPLIAVAGVTKPAFENNARFAEYP